MDLKEHCLSKGLIKGTAEYKREYEAEKWRRRSPESKKQHHRKVHERRRQRIKNDPIYAAKERERWKKVKQRQRQKEREKINERQRQNYKKRGEFGRKKIYESRNRREPHRGLANLIKAVRDGRLDPRVLIDYTSAAIEQCSALIHRGKRESIS